MSQTFANPENALKRASELIVVNQKNEAIDVLRTIITSRRHRTWQKSLESVMLKYIGLCVELRKGQEAKDGLHQYRGVCQQVNIASLGVVIKFFLEESERYAKEAQSKAEALNLESLEDLDAEETPESMMLGKVSGEDTKDRTDREIVTPWLKFLWETYRTVLDILRNNPKLEGLYQKTAQQAFAFCKKFKRNTEFRRLCDLLRGHLSSLGKYAYQPNSINIQAPESMQLHLETRFAQLNVACDLELWQEAFRTVEDIHGLMTMSKKPPKANIMANFYEKLTQIFWVSGNYLFHAYAWHKFYTLSRNHNKALTAEEMKTMASSVLLSALSIPIDTDRSSDQLDDLDDIVQKEKNIRLAALLGPISAPRRDVLLEELRAKNISTLVPAELQDLLYLLEDKFHPLELCESLKPKLEYIAAHPTLKQYLKPLEGTILVRLVQQLERVFQTMKLSELYKLAFFVDPTTLEKSLVDMISKGYVDLHIDHKNGALNFGSHNLGSDKLRGQLTTLARGLQSVVEIIQPKDEAAKADKKKKAFASILKNIVKEHQEALERKKLIEKRKEIKEQMANLLKAQAAAAQKEEEEKRNQAQREVEEKQRKEREQKLKEEALKAKAQEPEPEKQKAEQAAKAKKDMENKLQVLAKKMDYLERARREAERPLLESAAHKLQEEERRYYEAQQSALVEVQQQSHAKQLEEKKRLAKMQEFRKIFEEKLNKRREEEYQKKKAEQDERLAGIRAKLQKEREERAVREAKKKKQLEEKAKLAKEEAARREEEAAKLQKERELAEAQRRQEEEEARERDEELRRQSEEEEAREEEARRAKEAAWRREDRREAPVDRRREEPDRRRDDGDRRDEWRGSDRRRDEPPRREAPVDRRRDEPPRRDEGRDDGWRRDERRDDRRRDEPPRRDEGRWGGDRRRDEPPRRDEGRDDRWGGDRRRDEPPRRDEGRDEWRGRRDEDRDRRDVGRRDDERRRDEPPRRDEGRWGGDRRRDEGRDEPPRRDEGRWGGDRRRDEPPRRDEGRDEPPRRDEGRDERRRDEEPRRPQESGGDNAWKRGGGSNIRAPAEPREREREREREPPVGRREAERRPPARAEREAPARREPSPPRERPAPEAEPAGGEAVGDDGWSTVPAKRGRRGGRGN